MWTSNSSPYKLLSSFTHAYISGIEVPPSAQPYSAMVNVSPTFTGMDLTDSMARGERNFMLSSESENLEVKKPLPETMYSVCVQK